MSNEQNRRSGKSGGPKRASHDPKPRVSQRRPQRRPESQPLTDEHRQHLRLSGVSEAIIDQRYPDNMYRYTSVAKDGHLQLGPLGFSAAQRAGMPGLLIRYRNGSEPSTLQFRPDNPRTARGPKPTDGRTRMIKYESPPRQPVDIDLPSKDVLQDKRVSLVVTEGAKKADAARSKNYAAIALLGVAMWRCPTWKTFPLSGRDVYIVFDSDATEKPEVQQQERKLATFLAELGAKVRVARLQSGQKGEKVGLDDFLAGGGDLEELLAQAETLSPPKMGQPDDDPRPSLDVTNEADLIDHLHRELGVGPLAGVYRRGDQIVRVPRIGQDGYKPAEGPRDDDGPAKIDVLDTQTLRALIGRRHWTYVETAKGNRVHRQPPPGACQSVLALPEECKRLPVLRSVTHTPLVRASGTILTQPGYDSEEGSGLIYLPIDGLMVPDVPTRPTRKQALAALELLLELIADFPFCSHADRANFLGLWLTPLLRAFSPPPWPFGVINAPMQGSGKTLLAGLLRTTHGAVVRGEMPGDEAEMRKSITSILANTAAPVVVFDNVTGVLRSAQFATVVTKGPGDPWSDRWLGQSRELSWPADRLWVVTGNNVALRDDLPRRALWVTIDANVPEPEKRSSFKIANLESHVREMRGEIICALLTIVRAWVTTGRRKRPPGVPMDNFHKWAGAVNGILHLVGIDDFRGEDAEPKIHDAEREEWHAFLGGLADRFGADPFTVAQVIEELSNQGRLTGCLPGDLADKHARHITGAGFARTLGLWFANRDGRWVDDLVVRSLPKPSASNTRLWQVLAAG